MTLKKGREQQNHEGRMLTMRRVKWNAKWIIDKTASLCNVAQKKQKIASTERKPGSHT